MTGPGAPGPTPEARVADSEAALWSEFAGATSPEVFVRGWLALQCRRIGGVAAGVVLLGASEQGPFSPAAVWPDRRRSVAYLTEIAERGLTERRGLVRRAERSGHPDAPARERYEIAYPIELDGRLRGVVALDVAPRPEPQLEAVLRQLHWGSAWFEVLFRREAGARDAATRERLESALDLVATAVAEERFYGAASAFATALATRLGCDRASVGFLRRGRVRVRATSHSARFGKDTNLIRGIGSAMDEAVDQHGVVVYPTPPERPPMVTRAHAELARISGTAAICSVPLADGRRIVGALTLERPAERPFDAATVELTEAVAALVGPILDVQRREDRWLVAKAVDAGRTQLGYLIGPRHVGRKLVAAGLFLAVGFLAFGTGDYRVSAKTTIEAAIQRAAVAPIDGYIARGEVRPGDRVFQGQPLAALDDRDLKLELQRRQSEREQLVKQFHRALAERNAADARIIRAQIDQVDAQLALLEDHLARLVIRAPVDGVIVAGDVNQRLGAPVGRGQVLFEVAPLESFRVVLQVDERDIGQLALGQRGFAVLSGLPTESLPLVVEKITPVSTAAEGRNFFRVEARLEGAGEGIQPGMEGVSKVVIDRRRLVWIWTHAVIDWFRITFWAYLP